MLRPMCLVLLSYNLLLHRKHVVCYVSQTFYVGAVGLMDFESDI